MSTRRRRKRRPPVVRVVESTYQPTKAEKEELLAFPEGTTPEDLVRAVTRTVRLRPVRRDQVR
ncbi:MAG: hypothetical protein OXG33_04155 [Chloroflexi bacterium]|nr:hypothetical protein [Chloroflexota bacterium]